MKSQDYRSEVEGVSALEALRDSVVRELLDSEIDAVCAGDETANSGFHNDINASFNGG